MIKNILLKVSKIGNLVVAWFNFFMFFAMRPCWSGISKTLGYEKNPTWLMYNLPVIIWILLFGEKQPQVSGDQHHPAGKMRIDPLPEKAGNAKCKNADCKRLLHDHTNNDAVSGSDKFEHSD